MPKTHKPTQIVLLVCTLRKHSHGTKILHPRKRACRHIATTQKGLSCMYNVSVSVIRNFTYIINVVTESISAMGKGSFFPLLLKRADRIWCSPSLLFSEGQGFCLRGQSGWIVSSSVNVISRVKKYSNYTCISSYVFHDVVVEGCINFTSVISRSLSPRHGAS